MVQVIRTDLGKFIINAGYGRHIPAFDGCGPAQLFYYCFCFSQRIYRGHIISGHNRFFRYGRQ